MLRQSWMSRADNCRRQAGLAAAPRVHPLGKVTTASASCDSAMWASSIGAAAQLGSQAPLWGCHHVTTASGGGCLDSCSCHSTGMLNTTRLAMALAGVFLCAGLTAQVPYGHSIASYYMSTATTTSPDGLMLVDPTTGTCKVVNGLRAMRGDPDVNAVQIDPIDDSIWIGGHRASSGQLDRVFLDAAGNVIASVPWGSVTAATSTLNGITFDLNGNPVVGGRGGVYRFNRLMPGGASLLAPTASSTTSVTSICTDPAGNIYFGGDTGELYRMAVQPDCTYAAPLFLASVSSTGASGPVEGIEFCPGSPSQLFWVVDGNPGGVGTFTLPAGPSSPSTPTGNYYHSIDYDPDDDVFLATTHAAAPEQVHIVTKGRSTSTGCSFPAGGIWSTGIDTVDSVPGDLTVVPACPPKGTGFPLELMVQCKPGDQGGIFIVSPVALTVTVGPVPASGKLVSTVPNVVVPSTFPAGLLVFAGVCFDATTGQLTVSSPVAWPRF